MKTISKDRYMEVLEKVLKNATYKNKEKIEEIMKRDFDKRVITEETYLEASKRVKEYYKNQPIKARIKTTTYPTIEALEEAIGVKIEGHKYRKIEWLEEEEIL